MRDMHDGRLVLIAALVCAVGIYASFAIAQHAARASRNLRLRWGAVSVAASGSTARATHFIVLLAFEPGMPAAFAPVSTIVSLACAIVGIGAGVLLALRSRTRPMKFASGLVVGVGVTTLHYVGQSAYLVQGTVHWDTGLVIASIAVSLPISGFAMLAGASRSRRVRLAAPPLLLLSIAVLHFCGMAAMTLRYDPAMRLPADAITPNAITPVVAGVSVVLILLAILGWRFDLSATARLRQDRRRLRELADVALEGLLICRGDIVVTANDSVEALSGHMPGTLTGSFVSALLPGLDISSMPEREEREINLVGADGRTVAEETGLIVPLGEWVLQTACAQAATWPEAMGVAVNLSPAQFREKTLIGIVGGALRQGGLAPDRLELEITEGVLLSDEQGTLETLKSLIELGVRVSMDDFGTGYSSLSYLRKFPFHKIKIDQSFFSQLPDDEESAAIVRAIITMAKCLGMSTTVEGVETIEQFDFSVEAGCDSLQGYLISRPLAVADLASFVASGEDVLPRRVAA